VRNHNDKSYGKGKKIDNDDMYDLDGFQIRFLRATSQILGEI
jgi:hypothetical protein